MGDKLVWLWEPLYAFVGTPYKIKTEVTVITL